MNTEQTSKNIFKKKNHQKSEMFDAYVLLACELLAFDIQFTKCC